MVVENVIEIWKRNSYFCLPRIGTVVAGFVCRNVCCLLSIWSSGGPLRSVDEGERACEDYRIRIVLHEYAIFQLMRG